MKTVAGCNYRAREQDVFMKIVEAYYGILEAEKFVRAADQEIMQMEQHLKVSKLSMKFKLQSNWLQTHTKSSKFITPTDIICLPQQAWILLTGMQ